MIHRVSQNSCYCSWLLFNTWWLWQQVFEFVLLHFDLWLIIIWPLPHGMGLVSPSPSLRFQTTSHYVLSGRFCFWGYFMEIFKVPFFKTRNITLLEIDVDAFRERRGLLGGHTMQTTRLCLLNFTSLMITPRFDFLKIFFENEILLNVIIFYMLFFLIAFQCMVDFNFSTLWWAGMFLK